MDRGTNRVVWVRVATVKMQVGGVGRLGRLPSRTPGTGRTPEAVALALQYAHERYHDHRSEMAGIEPPRLRPPHPPRLLYAFWLAGTVALALLITTQA
jgi:hypothetical protein